MATFMSWLFHPVETGGGREAPTGRAEPSGLTLFLGLEVLAHRQGALLDALTPVREKAALISFVGMGITDPSRYEDAAAVSLQLALMAPANEGGLIQVFVQQLREESLGSDFLYVHFAGDPLSLGFLICTLYGGGLMAGWTRLVAPGAASAGRSLRPHRGAGAPGGARSPSSAR